MSAAYPWNKPNPLGFTEIPPPAKTTYTDTLRALPDDQAALFEYATKDAVRYAQSMVPGLAKQIGLLVSTRTYRTQTGTWHLLVWKRRSEDRRLYQSSRAVNVTFTLAPEEA